ncbi:MAG: HAD hydrolase-like protein [Planctomycetes bacterium]|jgi:phosphoglycolate phosphatase|nr:HAD hydrolase-like protein [Phycisphaerae bacterium]NBB94374.1 HAD hydrolase-like protein [Planctomycetota bacterium]
MKRYPIILFDLDGTLTDPTMEIVKSAQYALHQFGVEESDPEKLRAFANTPLLQCFEQDFGLSADQADQAFEYYWHYAGSLALRDNRVYAGVPEMLEQLQADDRTLCVATARKTDNARKVLAAVGLKTFFPEHQVLGTDDNAARSNKKMVIFDLLCSLDEHHHEDVIMVGDRKSDLIGAYKNGVDSMAVTWGSETLDELKSAEPTCIAASVREMAQLLLAAQ